MSHPSKGADRERDIAALADLARHPSVGVKISGFNYNSARAWDYPYADSIALFGRILAAFGDQRLYWGSDFPASRDDLTYRQSLEVVRTHCASAGDAAVVGHPRRQRRPPPPICPPPDTAHAIPQKREQP